MDLGNMKKTADKDAMGIELDDALLDGIAGGEVAPVDNLDWDPNGCPDCGTKLERYQLGVYICPKCGYIK